MSQLDAELKRQVVQRFATLARFPEQGQKWPFGPGSAKSLGYDAREIDELPASRTESCAGGGNPISLGGVHAGQTVLDIGCGAGLDSILAGRRVGASGKVIGIDLTPEMVDKARRNAALVGLTHVDFREGDVTALPLTDESVDVIISNGVFNLCSDKPKAIGEMFRVLRPGGRIQMADILLHEAVTPEEVAAMGEWSD